MFEHTIRQLFNGINGVLNLSDDILVYGVDKASHDRALDQVCKHLKDNKTLNKPKCEFNKSCLEFFGYIFTKDSMSPDPRKVAAIKQLCPPARYVA